MFGNSGLPPLAWVDRTSLASAVGSNDIYAVASSGSLFVAAGSYAACATSPDGITWTSQSGISTALGSGTSIFAMCWSGSIFVAVGLYGTCATSSDGITWTARTFPSAGAAICWTGTQFLVVGYDSAVTSPDGITWTSQAGLTSALGSGITFRAVHWNGSQFIAVGDCYGHKCGTSPDGVTWTARTLTGFGGSVPYAVSSRQGNITVVGNMKCSTSSDGVTWTADTSISSVYPLRAACCTSTQVVAVGQGGYSASSTNGRGWGLEPAFATTDFASKACNAICWSGTTLVAVGDSGACATA